MAFMTLSFLATAVFASSATPVKWPELADHLQRQGVVIESMPVVDCPAGIDEDSAEHLVCQIIENTFYKWKEYEFFNAAGEVQLAVKMIKPEVHRLTAAEAGVLLNASKQLVQQNLRASANFMTRQPPNEPSLAYLPAYSGSSRSSVDTTAPEMSVDSRTAIPGDRTNNFYTNDFSRLASGVIGSDDRVRVTSIATITDYPWNTICAVYSYNPEGTYSGSGVLIAPYCVLTCGHIVLPPVTSGWAQNTVVIPAQHQDYEGDYRMMEYGDVAAADLRTNDRYLDTWDFEYDYGAVLPGQRFSWISTFMPIEYDATPSVVNHAGYPGEVQGETYSEDMWFASGNVTGYSGVDDRIMLLDMDVTGGQSGGPVWTYDATTGSRRLVALVSCGCAALGNGATRLVSVMEPLISEWMQFDPDDSYENFSYIPYFSVVDNRWTGIALANYNDVGAEFKIDYYRCDGLPLGSEVKSINAFGQISFAIDKDFGPDGWIKVSSTAPLTGLALIGDSENAAMFDIDLKTSLHRKFLCPHLAANDDWRSLALVCNPNDTDAELSFTYYDSDGSQVARITAWPIPAFGSIEEPLFDLFQQELDGGTLVIETEQPVTAFLLYDNKSTTWKAGLSAVPVD
jgi:V8-like Glu-specific endopeptidase